MQSVLRRWAYWGAAGIASYLVLVEISTLVQRWGAGGILVGVAMAPVAALVIPIFLLFDGVFVPGVLEAVGLVLAGVVMVTRTKSKTKAVDR